MQSTTAIMLMVRFRFSLRISAKAPFKNVRPTARTRAAVSVNI